MRGYPKTLPRSRILVAVRDLSLHKAAGSGSLEEVEALLAKKKDINGRDEQGRTPLHLAAMRGQFEVARLLIERDADLDAVDENGKTPLHYAAGADKDGAS